MRWIVLTLAAVSLAACKADPPAPPPPPAEAAAEPEAPASQPASQPSPSNPHGVVEAPKPVEVEPAPPPVEPSEDAPDPKAPYTFSPAAAGALCRYTYKQVVNEVLGGDFYAGAEIEVGYVLRVKALKAGLGFSMQAEAETLKMRGKREDAHTELDFSRVADVRRVEGGADATVEPDTVAWFALLDRPVTIHLDARGRFVRLEGGDAVRKRFLAVHPLRPRKDPRYKKLAEVRLSDEAIAERFLPYSVHVFEEGALEKGRKDKQELDVFTPDHRAHALRARRIDDKGKKVLFETRWGFVPTEEKNVVPESPDANVLAFLGGEGSELVSFEANNPCFLQAAQTRSLMHNWRGTVQGELVTSERRTVTTTIWRKAM